MIVLLATLLLANPCKRYGPVDNFVACDLFQSNEEATNFGAHVGFALAIPSLGYVVGGERGAMYAGAGWLTFAVINEFVLHGPESERERALNLAAKMIPCIAVMLWVHLKESR